MIKENKLKVLTKNYVSINLLSIWFAFMCGYAISISNYTIASTSLLGLYFTIMLKEKYKEEILNDKKKE
jgi:hypothetical protein